MPVTAKLSGRFYERFGDEITNELVDWFNAVDTTYQDQVREINESNRAYMDARFDANRAYMDGRFNAFDSRIDAFEQKMIARMDAFEAKMDAKFANFRVQMVLWMFGFWTATVVPIIGLMLALNRH